MSKTVTSTVKKFPGTVTLKDPLLLADAIAWEQLQDKTRSMLDPILDAEGNETGTGERKPGITQSQYEAVILEGVRACVEAWNLEGFDPDNPPMTPKIHVTKLMYWLRNEIQAIYYGLEPPNE